MGIQINGNTNNINAGIGSLSIEDLREIDIVGVATASNFKTGVSNLHNVGLTLSGGQIDVGSNIKIGTAGVVTATAFHGDGSNLTGIAADKIFEGNTEVETVDTGSDGHIKFVTEGSERVRVKSNGYVGIGTNNPQRPFVISDDGAAGAEFNIPDNFGGLSLNLYNRTTTGFHPLTFNAADIRFGINAIEKVRIDTNGILAVGHTSSPTSDADKLQVISTASGTGICLHNYSASNYGNQIAFMKSRSNTIGTNTVLNAYDRIGELNFYGNDGSGRSLGAQIQVRTDGTTTDNNTPAYLAFNTGLNQTMQTRLRISSSGVSCFSKTNASTGVAEPGSFILNVHTGAELNDGIKIVTNHNSGNQNSDSGKLMFCGEGQANGVYIYKDNAISYGKGDMVFHTKSTANDYTTQLSETLRLTAYGRFGLGTGGPGQTTVDSLMHIMGNSDNGDEHCQLTIEDSDTTAGSVVPQIVFKGNGSQLCKIRATDSNIIRIYDNNDAERWLINEYGETISEESEHGWSTYEHHAKSGGTRFHYRQVGTGASGTTINLIRVRRHYWGAGNYKITMKQTYYNGSYESIFWLNGHAANGNTTSFSIAHSNENSGNGSWIQKTATSHSAPGNNYAGWTDVYANLSAYTYYEITIEASMMSSYSHNINSIGNDGYALHAF